MANDLTITRRGVLKASVAGTALTLLGAASSAATSGSGERAIIDVHAHAILRAWRKGASERNRRLGSDFNFVLPDWSPESHLRVMDTHGIAASILSLPRATADLTGQASRDLARAMNEEFAEIMARYPQRFGAFAVLPIDDPDAMLEETQYALDVLKLSGVAAVTQVDGAYLGDPKYDDWLAELNRRRARLFVHPVPPPAFEAVDIGLNQAILEYMYETTRMLANMVFSGARKRFPDIPFIATHAGGTMPFLAHRIAVLEPIFGAGKASQGRPTLTPEEIFSTLSTFYYDLTASTGAAQLDAIRRLVPASQLLMGFDYPMMPDDTIAPALASFDRYTGLTANERKMIFRGNAAKMFPEFA